MSTYWIVQWQLSDFSRLEELLALASEFKPHGERLGAVDQRLYQPLTGSGEAANRTLTYTAEFSDTSAFGGWVDQLNADPDIQAWIAKATGPDAPATIAMRGIATDLPF